MWVRLIKLCSSLLIELTVVSIIIRILLFEEIGFLPVHAFNFYTEIHHIIVCDYYTNDFLYVFL